MKKLLIIFSLLLSFSTLWAGELQKILASDTTTPTPSGCTKIVFAKGSSCDAIPSMVIVNDANEEFTLVANSSSSVPYMYFIPDGSYKVVKMTNIATCNSASGKLGVGSSFSVPSVGYFTIESKHDPHTNTQPSYGPYPMSYDASKPNGYSKVTVDSSEKYINGHLNIKNLGTGDTYTLYGSATYYRTWYYYIPMGQYRVVSVSQDCRTTINGTTAYVGYKFTFTASGSVLYSE